MESISRMLQSAEAAVGAPQRWPPPPVFPIRQSVGNLVHDLGTTLMWAARSAVLMSWQTSERKRVGLELKMLTTPTSVCILSKDHDRINDTRLGNRFWETLVSVYYLGTIHHTHVVSLCGRATKQWFTLKNKNTIAAGIIFSFFCSAFTSPKCSQMLDVSGMKLGLTWRQLACRRGVLSLVGKKGGETALVCGQRSFIAVNYLLTRKSQSAGPTAGVLGNCLFSHLSLSGADRSTLN